MWYSDLGYDYPEDYFLDPVRFPEAAKIQNGPIVRMSLAMMCDDNGIPRAGDLRCCRSCGRMTKEDKTCSECGSPV